jgi:hypothetical protein
MTPQKKGTSGCYATTAASPTAGGARIRALVGIVGRSGKSNRMRGRELIPASRRARHLGREILADGRGIDELVHCGEADRPRERAAGRDDVECERVAVQDGLAHCVV